MIDTLREMGFETILVHGRQLRGENLELLSNQWGCDKPVCRTNATSPTFSRRVVLCRPWQNPNNAGIRETAAGVWSQQRYRTVFPMSLKGQNGAHTVMGIEFHNGRCCLISVSIFMNKYRENTDKH